MRRNGRQHSSLKPLNTPTVFHVIYQGDLERMLNSTSSEATVYTETPEHEALTSNQSNVTPARAFPGRREEKSGNAEEAADGRRVPFSLGKRRPEVEGERFNDRQ